MTDAILFDRPAPHVARITLNRAEARNAINAAMTARIEALVDEIEGDSEIRAAILTAAPGRAFCAGADLAEVAAGRGSDLVSDRFGFAGFVYASRAKPWIAAVHGFVLGGGLELSLACDMIIAADNASFGLPEPKRGILAGAGGVYRLARAIPRAIALEMLATGTAISAARGHELGLVNRVVPEASLQEEAIALAEAIAANAPLAVRESLAIGRIAAEREESALRSMLQGAIERIMASEDAREGPTAFVEKRAPVWRSR